ncbi:MAG: glycosyltransferase family 39 protein, partial [Chloroflexota bacterium]|nr:glycosyltransferase family 39 protein [Chloroflexota bacterium]
MQPDAAARPIQAARGFFATVRPHLPLLAIVLLGVGLRLWMIGISPLDPSYSNADDGDYYRRALRLALTGQYIDDNWLIRPPLHVFFYALWLRLAIMIGRPALGVPFIQLAQTGLAALTIMLGYGIGRRLFPTRQNLAGLLFALFLSTWYSFVEQPSVLFSELIYMFLFFLHVWLLLRFDTSGRLRYLALSGFALGAATLTRSPALYSLAFVVLWLLMRAWTTDPSTPLRAGD